MSSLHLTGYSPPAVGLGDFVEGLRPPHLPLNQALPTNGSVATYAEAPDHLDEQQSKPYPEELDH